VVLRPAAPPGPPCDVSADQLVQAASLVAARTPLARTWSTPESEWQCSRVGIVCARRGTDARAGIVTGYVMPLSNPDRTKCLVVEDVLWDGLDAGDREAVVAELVARGAAAGARVAIVPDLGYADLAPFAAAKFRPSGRRIHVYLSLWDEPQPAEAVSGYYLDVF